MNLPRKNYQDVPETMFIRPRVPSDHREFEMLLPQLTPLFVYADDEGRDWVRWDMPRSVAQSLGWGDMKCACCDARTAVGDDSSFHIDTAYDETDWFLEGSL